MFVEFIGLPGSGKSSIINAIVKQSAGSDSQFTTLKRLAEKVLAKKKSQRGYLRRKQDRGWFYGTFSLAHQYPELFRIAFENTLRNTPGQLDFLDLLAQYFFARQEQNLNQTVLVDEGLLHRGAATFLYPDAFSTFDHYLEQIPPCDVIVWMDIDIETAIERSKQRKKGLPRLYRRFSHSELVAAYRRLQDLHQNCLAHQRSTGVKIICLDSKKTLNENATCLCEALSTH